MALKLPAKVAVIGLDCAEPHLIEKHIEEGYLPNFKKLFEQGVLAQNCLVPYPTITPPNWCSIATGAWPGTHQVTDFNNHLPGTSHGNQNVRQAFSSIHWQAEAVWDALDKAGKKCIVLNFPGAWPSKMKNGIMVGGLGLSVSEYRDGFANMSVKQSVCFDQMIATGAYPFAISAKFEPASGWQNVPDTGSEPLQTEAKLSFPATLTKPSETVWYVLLRRGGKDSGYNLATLSPTRDFKDAFCTLRPGEWSSRVATRIKFPDSSEKEVFFRCKLIELSGDAQEFRFYISALSATSGWSSPESIAAELPLDNGLFAPSGGLVGYSQGWFDLDMYVELNNYYVTWLGDAATTLFKNHAWDAFLMHSHPTDWIYHVIMSDMDPITCPDAAKREHAWKIHRQIYECQDRLIGRIMEAAGDDTLFVLVSDHGATADGPTFNPYLPMAEAGLLVFDEATLKAFENLRQKSADQKVGVMKYQGAMRLSPDMTKTKAIPERSCYVYINLKGRDPGGIVEPANYEEVQQQVIDSLLCWVDPETGQRPVSAALSKKDARILGLYGEGVGDVVYAVYPWFGSQHGQQLPTAEWGVGSLKGLLSFTGPGIRKGYRLERTCGLPDIVPTICYLMNWPLPDKCEGAVLYQAFKDPNFKMEETGRLKESLNRMEQQLAGNKEA